MRTGFKLYANKKRHSIPPCHTLANAISGDYPDYELQFANALVSHGALTVATNGTATSSSGNVVISWDDNSGVGTAKATDKTLIAILNADRGEAVTVSAGEARVTGTQTLAVPADWLGENVHVYLGFVSEDFKEVANSVYLGSDTIA